MESLACKMIGVEQTSETGFDCTEVHTINFHMVHIKNSPSFFIQFYRPDPMHKVKEKQFLNFDQVLY